MRNLSGTVPVNIQCLRLGLSTLCTCKGHALGEADSCSCRALQQSPEPKFHYDTHVAGQLQDAVCRVSPECSYFSLCSDHSTGSTVHAPHSSVLSVCLCSLAIGVLQTRSVSWKEAVGCALFWDVTQRRLVVCYRRFGTTYRSRIQCQAV